MNSGIEKYIVSVPSSLLQNTVLRSSNSKGICLTEGGEKRFKAPFYTLSYQPFAIKTFGFAHTEALVAKPQLLHKYVQNRRFCNRKGESFAKVHLLFLKPHKPLPKNHTLSKIIREITPCADIRKIRRGRKVLQVPRIIPKGKRALHGIRRLLSVRSDKRFMQREERLSSIPTIADSKSKVPIKPLPQVHPLSSSSTVQKNEQVASKVNRFNLVDSSKTKRKTRTQRPGMGKESLCRMRLHHFLINEDLANTHENTNTQKSLHLSRALEASRYTWRDNLIHLYTKPKNVQVGNTSKKFSYTKKSEGITKHTPFYSSALVENQVSISHVNKLNALSRDTKERGTNSCFRAKRFAPSEYTKVDNENPGKIALCIRQDKYSSFSLAYSLRRIIQTSFSSRGTAMQNKRSGYRTIFANRGSIPMAWWL
jgi:hypothetical protein